MIYKNGECIHDFLGLFVLYSGGVFNKTIIPLALVGYEMIIANCDYGPRWLSIISYPTCAHGIIVKYMQSPTSNPTISPSTQSPLFSDNGQRKGRAWYPSLIAGY